MKYVSLIISIITVSGLLITVPLSYGKLQKGQEVNSDNIEKVEVKAEKAENDNIEQTVILREIKDALKAQQQLTQMMILELKK